MFSENDDELQRLLLRQFQRKMFLLTFASSSPVLLISFCRCIRQYYNNIQPSYPTLFDYLTDFLVKFKNLELQTIGDEKKLMKYIAVISSFIAKQHI